MTYPVIALSGVVLPVGLWLRGYRSSPSFSDDAGQRHMEITAGACGEIDTPPVGTEGVAQRDILCMADRVESGKAIDLQLVNGHRGAARSVSGIGDPLSSMDQDM